MGFSTCSMVVDDVHFHLFLFSLWLNVIAVMILNEWEWMEVVCWKMKLNLTIFLSFLFCNDESKQGMKFHSFCFSFCRFCRLLSILAKRIQSSFFLDCDLRKRDFDQIGRNDRNLNRICKECFEFVLFCFFFLIWGLLKRRNVERGLKSACSQ